MPAVEIKECGRLRIALLESLEDLGRQFEAEKC